MAKWLREETSYTREYTAQYMDRFDVCMYGQEREENIPTNLGLHTRIVGRWVDKREKHPHMGDCMHGYVDG